MPLEPGAVVLCPECGHASDAHAAEGCEARSWSCPCPLRPADILPMTQEQRDEFDRNRYRGNR